MNFFDNTQIAFASKSNFELKRLYWIYKFIGNYKLVKSGKKLLNFALKYKLPINWILKPTIYKTFCGGESIEKCNKTIESLAKYKIDTLLGYSMESNKNEIEFDKFKDEIILLINSASKNKNIPFCVFKVTGLARVYLLEKVNKKESLTDEEKFEYDKVYSRIYEVCRIASEKDVSIMIDAEESWIQDAIDDFAYKMMLIFNKEKQIIYNTVQLYRKDRLNYMKDLYEKALKLEFYIGLKLVRGAYMEQENLRAALNNYESPIHSTKQDTDKDYDSAMVFCIQNINKITICAGTHNEKSCVVLTDLIRENDIVSEDKQVYFSQLYGMSNHISYNLASFGFNVVKYVPYGPVESVIPYLIRRAEENTSITKQTGRELKLIKAERLRRKTVNQINKK